MLTMLPIMGPDLGWMHPDRILCERFRYKHYVIRLEYEPANVDGLEKDEFDFFTTYVTVVKNGNIVGFCRLVPSFTAAVALPLNSEFTDQEILGGIPRPTMEISRLMVDPDLPRTEQCAAATMIYERVCGYLSQTGVETAFAVLEPPLLYKLQRKYSAEAFTSVGRVKLSKKGERVLEHEPMKINVGVWADVLKDIRAKRAFVPVLAAA